MKEKNDFFKFLEPNVSNNDPNTLQLIRINNAKILMKIIK